MTWEEIHADPNLTNLPYRIESDKWGNVVLSPPPAADHAEYQSIVAATLLRLLPEGFSMGECPIQTREGVKAADAAWMSRERRRARPANSLTYLVAPEICVEVRSPSNSYREILEKLELYFDIGAKECWMCDQTGYMTFFNTEGQIARSVLCPDFPAQLSLEA